MLDWVVTRLARARLVDRIVVATTHLDADDELASWCEQHGVDVIRGPVDDVLERYRIAAQATGAERVLRVTSDCPLVDPALADAVAALLVANAVDYASNTLYGAGYPRGLAVEAMTREVLERAAAEATDPSEREHVTLHLYRRPESFSLSGIAAPGDSSMVRWTVDTADDLLAVEALAGAFADDRFTWRQALAAWVDHPEWASLNGHVEQNTVPPL